MDLQIIAFCFDLRYTQCPNFIGIEVYVCTYEQINMGAYEGLMFRVAT